MTRRFKVDTARVIAATFLFALASRAPAISK